MARRKSICCCCTPYMAPSPVVPFFSAPSGCVSTVSKGALPARNPVSNDISPLSTVVNGVCPCVVTNRAARLSNLTGACPPPQPVQVVTPPSVVQAPVVPPVQAAPVAPPPVAAQPAPAPQPPDSQPPTAISPTQNAGCTGALGSLNVPSIVPNPYPCFSGVSPLAAGAAESVLSNSTGAGVSPLAAGLAEDVITTRQPDQIPTAPVVTQPYGTTPTGSSDGSYSAATPPPTAPLSSPNITASSSECCCCLTPNQQKKLANNATNLQNAVTNSANVTKLNSASGISAQDRLNNILNSLPSSACYVKPACGDISRTACQVDRLNQTNVQNSDAAKTAYISGLPQECQQIYQAYVKSLQDKCTFGCILKDVAGFGLSAFLGPEIFGAMGLGSVGAAAASGALSSAITGGNPIVGALTAGLGSEASALLPSVLNPVSNSIGDITGSQLVGNSVANALGKGATSAAIAGLTGGCVGRAALTGAVAGGLTPVATNLAGYLDPSGTQAAQNVLGSTIGTAAGYKLTGGSAAQGALAGLESGLIGNAKGLMKCGLFVNQPNSNNDNQDTSTSNDGLQEVVSTGQRINDLNLDPTTGLPVENQTSNTSTDAKTSPLDTVNTGNNDNQDTSTSNDGLQEVVSTGQRINDLNLDPVTGLPISPSGGSEATQPQNDLQEVTTTASRIPDINVDPVTIPTTSTSQPVSSSPLNDTEITVTGSKTPTETPPEDVTPVLPTIDPKDLNFPKPDTVTTDTPKVSVGTASQTGSGTGGGSGSGGLGGLGGSGALKSIAPLVDIYGQTGDPKILEDIQQMVSQNTPKSDKGESRELEDLVMGKKNYYDETENSAKGGLVGYASGGSSGQFGSLFSSVNMFCCTSPQWSPSMKNNVLTYQGTGGKKPNFLLPMHLCTGSAQGHAKGGALPSHYREAAPEGHHPEFITGLTGFYACGGGTGQSDDIPAMLHDGDYVMDAETVSALGDGSSKAGREVLEGFMHKVPHKKVIGGNPVPAKIADGEYVFPAAFVTALGKGDNKAGAKILDGLREKLRAHKRAAPVNKIPPKAKSPLDYIKGAKG